MKNKLWECPLVIERGRNTEMPASWRGAVVAYYVAAVDHEAALRAAVDHLSSEGYVFKDLLNGQVFQLDAKDWWLGYVMKSYPEYADRFPSQEAVENIVANGGMFRGPFAGWDKPDAV